ncbi:MAG: alpha/beta fold hydrolase [Candidatus Woesearchaeota archaeon]|nr:alpha/beta fold hydrolase [Candidatus Woesearchaeota archaeon]
MKDVSLLTEDQVKIAATYYETTSEKGILLVHMYGQTRQSWRDIALFFQENGYQMLAIDLRGHGQSLEKNKQRISYINFHEQDFFDMLKDIQTAKKFLQQQGASDINVIGASLGANLALIAAVHDHEITKVVALSPGLNYKGLKPQDAVKKITIPVMLITSEDDQYGAMSVRTLEGVMHNEREVKMFPKADHGIRMFQQQPQLKKEIIAFLEKH